VSVTAFYTGANAQAVESAVTTPLEQVINGVEGMTYMTSSSTNSGIVDDHGHVRHRPRPGPGRRGRAEPRQLRRSAACRPTCAPTASRVTKNSAGFLGGLGFFSRDNRYDSQFISNYLDLYVRDAIKRVPGRGQRHHLRRAQVRHALWLDPGRLAARGLTAATSWARCASRTCRWRRQRSAMRRRPRPDVQMSVRAMGRLTEVSEFEDVVVKAGPDGALVRVSDVGRVELGAESTRRTCGSWGSRPRAWASSCCRRPTRSRLRRRHGDDGRLEPTFPPGLEWRLAFDNVSVVRESIIEVLKTLAEAIVLVVLVMFLFLQNWRSTIIPAITIPVSLIGTFAFIKLFDFSINTLTLFGIVLATGIVVDDAIVVIENIERHMTEYKKKARQAAIDAMREVFSAVVVIGIVLVAVFVPVAFFPGTTGRLYQQFSLTIAFAVVLSVFNAVTLTPALSALLLDKESHSHGGSSTAVNRVIDGGTRLLRAGVRGRCGSGYAMLVLFLGRRCGPPGGVPGGADGVRARGGRRLLHHDRAGAGGRLARVHDRNRQAGRADLYARAGHRGVFSVMGFSFAGAAPEQRPHLHAAEGLRRAAGAPSSRSGRAQPHARAAVRIPGAIVVPFAPPAIQGLSTFGGFQFEVLDQTGGADIGGLAQATFGDRPGNQSGRVQGLFSASRANDPQLVVEIDRDKARSLGLPLREVTDALQVFLGSQYVNDFDFNNRAYRVYVQADQGSAPPRPT
jgi:hydrophobic/amphiphilic exporter-1 (mainly G- bacteria), HAE1 family